MDPNGQASQQVEYYNDTQVKNEDAPESAWAGDGYTTEAISDPNAGGTDQTQADYDLQVAQENGQNYGNSYDPQQEQGYYYQGDDGNYYYYTNPQQQVPNEVPEDINVNIAPTRQNLVRSYEYDSWDPRRYNWFIDIVLDTFFSKPFLVYLTILFYCATVLIACVSLNYTFALLFRLFSVQFDSPNPNLEAFAYLAMFFYLSFLTVSFFCAIMDMVRNLWTQGREDTVFWAVSYGKMNRRRPPYVLYFLIIIATVFLPLLWGIVEAGTRKQSVVYVAQRYANVSVLAVSFIIVIWVIWLHWRAIVYKRSAVKKWRERDDFTALQKTLKKNPQKKVHWYHASTVLEEFGVDQGTLLYNSFVFTVGAVPIFALYTGATLSTFTGTPSIGWPAIASIALICVYVISWLSILHRKSQWATYISFGLICVLLILGIVGGAVSGTPTVIGVVVVLFLASHGMVSRKRKHSLTRKELCATLKIPYNAQLDPNEKMERCDTYLCCCRNLLLDYLRCFDVKKYFGYRHPDVVEAERRFMTSRMALRTDQKALLVWWIIVMLAVAFVIGLSNSVQYNFPSTIATTSGKAINGSSPDYSVCKIVFNEEGESPLKLYDLALLAVLSYTYGQNGNTDFATWFASSPTLIRAYPQNLPLTLNFATNGVNILFSDYVDISTNFHVITLNSNSRGIAVFRDLDEWGESISLQVAGAISPLISIWDETDRSAYVQGARFLKDWLPPSKALDAVEAHLVALINEGLGNKTILVGDQFNGGYAKLLSAKYGLPFIAFNPPGTKYKTDFLSNGTQLTSVRSLWSYVDSLEDSSDTLYFPCNDTISANLCGRLTTTLDYLLDTCGDSEGREMLGS